MQLTTREFNERREMGERPCCPYPPGETTALIIPVMGDPTC
jgi:hypothetical protein